MRFFTLVSLLCMVSYAFAQYPKSANYKKENDFMVAVLNNPTFSLFDFISVAEMHERNTQFLDESRYTKSNFIMKVKAAWRIFIEIQDTDVSYKGMGKYFVKHDMFDIDAPRNCPYPELKHKLSIVPLKLEEY